MKILESEIFEMTCCAQYWFMLKLWSVSQNVLHLLRELKLPWRQHEESVMPWKNCLQKPAFCGCWLRQFQAVSLDVQNRMFLNRRCSWFSIFGQNGLLQEKSMVVYFWLLQCFWAVGVCVQRETNTKFVLSVIFLMCSQQLIIFSTFMDISICA